MTYRPLLHSVALSALCLFLFVGCTKDGRFIRYGTPGEDINQGLVRGQENFHNLYETNKNEPPIPQAQVTMGAPPIPQVSQILATPKPPQLGETQLVSLAVTDDVPLKDVLIELARLADVDIELDANIQGGISFRAKEKPFNEVVDRIADLAGLRYSMKNGVLRVELDTPYVQNYPLDFLNMDRSGSMATSLATNVLGASEGGSGGLNAGSTSAIKSDINGDFWKSFEEGLKDILAYQPAKRISQNISLPEFEAAGLSTTEQVGPAPTPGTSSSTTTTTAGGGTSSTTTTTTTPAPAPPAPGPTVASIPPSAPRSNGNTAVAEGTNNPFYVLNRQAGVVTISATSRQHQMIKAYIDKVRANASAQVLLEAKIVVVNLKDEFQSGINWARLGRTSFLTEDADGNTVSTANLSPPGSSILGTVPGGFSFNISDNLGIFDLDTAITLAENFGTTRTLSSPRLHAMNNQQAVLTFAQNEVYFTLKIDNQTTTGASTSDNKITVNSEMKTVPIGIILSMQPSVNTETNEITLNVRPTLSRIADRIKDPAVNIALTTLDNPPPNLEDFQSLIPVVEVRELDSILKLKSGQVMVIGGLMEQKSENLNNNVPGLAGIPWLGNLFKGATKINDNSELIIFIRATVVGNQGSYHGTDKKLYEKYINDPRPIAF